MAHFCAWHTPCYTQDMLKKIARLFIIKTRIEVYMIVYALGLGATKRGEQYLVDYPGYGGYLLFAACTGAVFMAGAKMLEAVELREKFLVD
jgi:hypothetical protein